MVTCLAKLQCLGGGGVGVADRHKPQAFALVAVAGAAPEHGTPDIFLPPFEVWVVVEHPGAEDHRSPVPLAGLAAGREVVALLQFLDLVRENCHLWVVGPLLVG